MRLGLTLRRSGSHRLACLSLYRALLKQCDQFPRATISSNLRQLVHYRFAEDRRLNSLQRINEALDFGYDALNTLEKAHSGCQSALEHLTRVLSFATTHATDTAKLRAHQTSLRSPTRPSKLRKVEHVRAVANKANHTQRPDAVPVLERPVPQSQLPGPTRVIPKFIVTQGIPFLRYGRLQPISLSRVIRQLARADAKRWDQRAELEYLKVMARLEDEWDTLVTAYTGYRDPPDDYEDSGLMFKTTEVRPIWMSWAQDTLDAERELARMMAEKHRKRAEIANGMFEVVVKERELATQEKKERKRLRKLERQDKQIEDENSSMAVAR